MINGGYMPLSHSDGEEEALHASEPSTERRSNHQNGLGPALSNPDDPGKNPTPLSLQRKLCLSLSLFMCFVYIVAFLVFLPCFDSSEQHISFKNKWSIFINFENTSTILAPVVNKELQLVIGLEGGDLVSLLGTSGSIRWNVPLYKTPRGINCDIFTNKNPTCLVWGSQGLLALVNPLTGTVTWHLHSHNEAFETLQYLGHIDPVAVPDADGDGIEDLMIAMVAHETRNISNDFFLGLVSGASGQLLGASSFGCPASNIFPALCFWETRHQPSLIVHCGSQNASVLWKLPLQDFLNDVTNSRPLSFKKFYSFNHSLENVSLFTSPSHHYLVVLFNGAALSVFHANKLLYVLSMSQGSLRNTAFGHYKNYSEVSVLLYSFPNGTQLHLINIQDGSFLKSIPMENAATFYTLPRDLNVILVKTAIQETSEFENFLKVAYHLIYHEDIYKIKAYTHSNISSNIDDFKTLSKTETSKSHPS